MTIKFWNGRRTDAVLLGWTGDRMRVIARGDDETLEVSRIRGAWVTEDCEPVSIQFAWEAADRRRENGENECICPPEAAARLAAQLRVLGEAVPFGSGLPHSELEISGWLASQVEHCLPN